MPDTPERRSRERLELELRELEHWLVVCKGMAELSQYVPIITGRINVLKNTLEKLK
jgi:hypothetical protein